MSAGTEFPLTLTIRALDKVTGPLRAMTAKLKGITAPFRAFGKDFKNFSEAAGLAKIGDGFRGVGSAVSGVGREAFALGAKLFALAGVAGFALFSVVRGAVDAGDKLGEMAGRVGLSVNAYASLEHAAAKADVSQEQFSASMDRLNKAMGEAKAGGGDLLGFLQKVSPSLAKQFKSAKTTEQGLSLLTKAFELLPDTQRRAALSAHAFGKANLQMGEFLHQGGVEIQKQQLAYLALVGSQEEFAKNAGDLDNAMKDTETAFLGLRSAALGALFPAFTKLSKALTDFIVKHRDGIARWATETGAAISAWIAGGGVERLVEGLREFGKSAAWLFDKIGGLKGALVGVGLFMAGPLIVSILGVIPALISLAVAMAPLVAAMAPVLIAAAGIAAIGATIYIAWEPIKALFNGITEAIAGLLSISVGLHTLDFGQVIDGWTRAIKGWLASIMPALQVLSLIPGIGSGVAAALTLSGDSPLLLGGGSAPALGAAAARVDPASVSSSASRSVVEVNFSNVPRGVQVSTEPNSSQPLDLSVGRSMVGG